MPFMNRDEKRVNTVTLNLQASSQFYLTGLICMFTSNRCVSNFSTFSASFNTPKSLES